MNDTKKILEDILELQEQTRTLKTTLNDRVIDVSLRYVRKEDKKYSMCKKRFKHWKINSQCSYICVVFQGNEFDSSISFPINYLYDEEAMLEFEHERAIKTKLQQKKVEANQMRKDIETYKKLKKKFEDHE